MKQILVWSVICGLSTSCTTLSDSLKLGALTGAALGAAAQYTSLRSLGQPATMEDAAVGASVGLGVGLLTSYLIHQAVVSDRGVSEKQTEMYFGDLPPSPFVFPRINQKKGRR